MSWDHGYFSGQSYCATVIPQMAPAWLDFAGLVKGVASPRRIEGEPFRYLDLGCGTGLGLCLLASLYPEGQFTGVDFMPGHIAQARWLARSLELTNVTFREDDLVELSRSSDVLGEPQHYVVAHGVYTWVDTGVQEALLGLTTQVLEPGGFFYCSYNTQPGWLGRTAFQMLVALERGRHPTATPGEAFVAARARLEAVLRHPEAPFSTAQPQLRTALPAVDQPAELAYLCGEYLPEAWRPLYVSEVHPRMRAHKLEYVATAILNQLHEGFLNAAVAPLVLEESDPLIREATFDLVLNQGFRRDLFAKGPRRLPPGARLEQLAAIGLRRLGLGPWGDCTFTTQFGRIELEPRIMLALEAALAQGPQTLGAVAMQLDIDLQELLPSILLLLDGSRIGLDRGAAAPTAPPMAAFNARLRALTQEGHATGHQLLPAAGATSDVPYLDSLILEGLVQGLGQDDVVTLVLMTVATNGRRLLDKQGNAVVDPDLQLRLMRESVSRIASTVLPLIRENGGLPEDMDGEG